MLPRVINKLVLCINPEVDIQERAKEMSGLTNECLSQQKKLKTYISSIKSFLDQLKRPICLIAHFGNGFDFKVLKMELERIKDLSDDFVSLYCADSLDALRELDPVASMKKQTEEVDNRNDVIEELYVRPGMKRSRTEYESLRGKATASPFKKANSLPYEFLPQQNRSFGAREYFEEMFGRKPEDTHTAEGFCKALVNIIQYTPGFCKWLESNKRKLKDV